MNNLSFSRTGSPKNKKLILEMGKDLGFDLSPIDPLVRNNPKKNKSQKRRPGFVSYMQKKDKYFASMAYNTLYGNLGDLCLGKTVPFTFLDRLEKIHAKEMAKKNK